MKEINSGRWSPNGDGITSQRVAAGIRCNPEVFVEDLQPEQIFVAIVGRDGCYREKEDVDRLLEQLGLEISYRHDVMEKGLPDALIFEDTDTHRSVFDGLVEFVDTVYPLPETEEDDEVSETKGDNRPF